MPFDDAGGTTAVDCWALKVLVVLALPKIGFAAVLLPNGVGFAVDSPNDGVAVDEVPLPKLTGFWGAEN